MELKKMARLSGVKVSRQIRQYLNKNNNLQNMQQSQILDNIHFFIRINFFLDNLFIFNEF